MLRYEFIRKVDKGYEYNYFPEGNKNAPGVVFIESKGKGHIIEESSEDFGERYAFHAIRGIDLSKNSGIVAWY